LNVTDFNSGDTLHIKTVGSVTIQEAAEDTPLVYAPIETGEITMQLTDYLGDAWHVTDDLREDGTNIDMLMTQRSIESTRAIQEHFETRFLETANAGQVDADPNTINGFPHRIASSESNNVFALSHLIAMRLAFDKANVPAEGRIGIVDPVAEATLNGLVTITSDVSQFAANIIQGGMASGQRFIMNLYGWDILTSNRLPKGDFGDGTTSVTGGVANIFMSVLDDQTKPVMAAWRRMPKSEGERNKDRARDEFVVRARWGFGVQRVDTLGVIITSASNY
tara:strand:+ start:11470 stop:12306 length:837 start_codon:yes stop_codon:yes gene_type:complete